MMRPFWLLAILCLLFVTPARADDQPLAVVPQQGVVLLRNGQVLSGKITQAGDDYYVVLPMGEIRLAVSQVELVCHDLKEGYDRKRTRLDPDNAADHLDLALWCVRQKMFEEATHEIGDARTLSPRHPRIALVERQLQLARQQPTRAEYKTAAEDIPSNEDLDRLLRGMPAGTVETFTQTIQPLLLNTCATAGCHGPQAEGKLRLLRTQSAKTFSRRFTQRNLHSVLSLIDRGDPSASPLLTAPVAAHGTSKAAIFTNKEVAQYRQLAQWVMRVSQGPAADMPASVDTPDDHLSQQLPRTGKAGAERATVNALFGSASEASTVPALKGAKILDKSPEKQADKASPRKLSAHNEEPTADPFDPEVFNRQYLPPE